MSLSIKKVFWNLVTIKQDASEYCIYLDNHLLKTPKKTVLKLPNYKLANLLVDELKQQKDEIDFTKMPANRLANAAIDQTRNQIFETRKILEEYADTDLLFYRAEKPQELIDEQILIWDPFISWAENRFYIKLNITTGVIPIRQHPKSIELLVSQMTQMSSFQLTVFNKLVTISGSYILGLAALENTMSAESIWNAAILDENWQASIWGEDVEQKKNIELKKLEFLKAIEISAMLS